MENENKTKSTKSGRGRTRNYATVVYPESARSNWFEILVDEKISAFVSPLHDKDVNPTGEPKKAHFHVLLMFEGVKTSEQARQIFEKFDGVGCETVNSLRGYARYLCHLDNPEKYQYSPEDVKCLCGADYIATIGLAIDKYKALAEMEDFCEQYNITSFYLLSRYATKFRSDWSRILKDSGSVYMREYLKSRKWSIENNMNVLIDPETGEDLLK